MRDEKGVWQCGVHLAGVGLVTNHPGAHLKLGSVVDRNLNQQLSEWPAFRFPSQ